MSLNVCNINRARHLVKNAAATIMIKIARRLIGNTEFHLSVKM